VNTAQSTQTFTRDSFFQNWFDCQMAFKQANDNTDAAAIRAWARSRTCDAAFSQQTKAAMKSADAACRMSMQMNNRS
jgi:hypothetical protein